MPDPRLHAAALLAAVVLWAPASALAAEPTLLAQIDDATPAPTAEPQPPLTEEPPTDLDGNGGGDGGGGDSDRGDTADPLPETGLDAGLVAVLGLGLIASGSGLRLKLRDAG